MYFKSAPGDDAALRVLEVKKNKYGPVTNRSSCAGGTASMSSSPATGRSNGWPPRPRSITCSSSCCGGSPSRAATSATRPARHTRRASSPRSRKPRRPRVTKKAIAEAMVRLFAAQDHVRRAAPHIEQAGSSRPNAIARRSSRSRPTPRPTASQHPANTQPTGGAGHTPTPPTQLAGAKRALAAPRPRPTGSKGKRTRKRKGDGPPAHSTCSGPNPAPGASSADARTARCT